FLEEREVVKFIRAAPCLERIKFLNLVTFCRTFNSFVPGELKNLKEITLQGHPIQRSENITSGLIALFKAAPFLEKISITGCSIKKLGNIFNSFDKGRLINLKKVHYSYDCLRSDADSSVSYYHTDLAALSEAAPNLEELEIQPVSAKYPARNMSTQSDILERL